MTQKLPPKSSSSAAAAADGSDHQKLEVAIKMLNKDSQQVLKNNKNKKIRSCACLVAFCTVFCSLFFHLDITRFLLSPGG
jgi:hypothetical protein